MLQRYFKDFRPSEISILLVLILVLVLKILCFVLLLFTSELVIEISNSPFPCYWTNPLCCINMSKNVRTKPTNNICSVLVLQKYFKVFRPLEISILFVPILVSKPKVFCFYLCTWFKNTYQNLHLLYVFVLMRQKYKI